jgi:hypothetical protein
MKKLIITIAIVLGLSMTSFAQGGLFHRGANADGTPSEVSLTGDGTRGPGDHTPMLPIHQQDGENQPAPLGSGIALLTALGAGYLISKRREE